MVPDYDTPEQLKALAEKLISFSRVGDEEIKIGYVIHPDHQGRGFATEAVRALLCELSAARTIPMS